VRPVHGGCVVKAIAYGNRQAAFGDIQVDGLVQPARVLRCVLDEYVFAGDSEIRRAIFNISGHV